MNVSSWELIGVPEELLQRARPPRYVVAGSLGDLALGLDSASSSGWQDVPGIFAQQPQASPDQIFQTPILSPTHPQQDEQ